MRRLAAAIAVALVLAPVGAAARREPATHVTLIGDSVASSLQLDMQARALVTPGVDMDLEVMACRRLVDPSCLPDTPTTLDVIKGLGPAIGPVVVIAVGYNDVESRYPANIETILDALEAAKVQKIFWLTLHAARHPYLSMNDAIVAAAAKHPEVTVVDWNLYSRSHPDWFQPDGVHVLKDGALAMATLIHDKLVAAGVAPPPLAVRTSLLPQAQRGKPYRTRLAAAGGRAPYAWSLAGRLPPGLHLRPSGLLFGAAHGRPGVFPFAVRVNDPFGDTATRRLVLRLR